jgi:hypothetical protein
LDFLFNIYRAYFVPLAVLLFFLSHVTPGASMFRKHSRLVLFWLPILLNNKSATYCDGYIVIVILDNTIRDPLSAVDTCVGFTNRRTYPLQTSLETCTYLYPAVA